MRSVLNGAGEVTGDDHVDQFGVRDVLLDRDRDILDPSLISVVGTILKQKGAHHR